MAVTVISTWKEPGPSGTKLPSRGLRWGQKKGGKGTTPAVVCPSGICLLPPVSQERSQGDALRGRGVAGWQQRYSLIYRTCPNPGERVLVPQRPRNVCSAVQSPRAVSLGTCPASKLCLLPANLQDPGDLSSRVQRPGISCVLTSSCSLGQLLPKGNVSKNKVDVWVNSFVHSFIICCAPAVLQKPTAQSAMCGPSSAYGLLLPMSGARSCERVSPTPF